MQNVGIGDVISIIIALGIIHGIMYFVARSRKSNPQAEDDSNTQGMWFLTAETSLFLLSR